jgi:hypothetical protein
MKRIPHEEDVYHSIWAAYYVTNVHPLMPREHKVTVAADAHAVAMNAMSIYRDGFEKFQKEIKKYNDKKDTNI